MKRPSLLPCTSPGYLPCVLSYLNMYLQEVYLSALAISLVLYMALSFHSVHRSLPRDSLHRKFRILTHSMDGLLSQKKHLSHRLKNNHKARQVQACLRALGETYAV